MKRARLPARPALGIPLFLYISLKPDKLTSAQSLVCNTRSGGQPFRANQNMSWVAGLVVSGLAKSEESFRFYASQFFDSCHWDPNAYAVLILRRTIMLVFPR